MIGSQQASRVSSGMAWIPRPRGGGVVGGRAVGAEVSACAYARARVWAGAWLGGWPGGDRDTWPPGGVYDDQPGETTRGCFMLPVACGAKHAAGVVAASVVTAVRAEEDVPAAAAVLTGTDAPLVGVVLDLAGDQVGEERGKIDGQAWLPGGAAIGVVPWAGAGRTGR